MKFNFSKTLQEIFDIIRKNKEQVRIVGGAVRDSLLNQKSPDIDLISTAQPEKIISIFNKEGFKILKTGIEFGTICLIKNGEKYEITTLRKDVENYGRYAKVEFSDNFEEDAARRDFTINAMSYDPFEQKLYDYFQGIADLKNSIVKFIGNADDRIKEDYLRILRFFRFSAKFAKEPDAEGIKACAANMDGLAQISIERVNAELTLIFSLKKNISSITLAIEQTKLFDSIAKNYSLNFVLLGKFEQKITTIAELDFSPMHIRAACLLCLMEDVRIASFLKQLKFSNHELKSISYLAQQIKKMQNLEKHELIYCICSCWYYNHAQINEVLILAYILGQISIDELNHNIRIMHPPAPLMPITSKELMEKGFKGIELGVRKKYLENQWIRSGFSLKKEVLIAL